MRTHLLVSCATTLLLAGLVGGCGDESETSARGAGGASTGGATPGTGGATPGTGGATPGTGGATTGGSAPATGGLLPATGGATPGTGGATPGTGGATPGTGGLLPATGGAPTGGSAPATGGLLPATGGAPTGGSAPATGGLLPATGGVPTGGSSPASGGDATGGSPPATGGSGPSTPSSGCSSTAAAPTGSAIDATLTVGGLTRTYRLSVPTDAAAGEPLPLVFALNGVGGDGKGAQSAFRLETNHRAIFVYPDSILDESLGSVAWDFDRDGHDFPFFDAMIDELSSTYCVDTDRIVVLGVSSGAIMANRLGCLRGDVFRAIAPASGMSWQDSCTGDVAVMVICGATDSYNPCETDAQGEIDLWTRENGCDATTTTSPLSDLCVEYQGCSAGNPVLLCTHPGGHMWPPEASDFAWDFFLGL